MPRCDPWRGRRVRPAAVRARPAGGQRPNQLFELWVLAAAVGSGSPAFIDRTWGPRDHAGAWGLMDRSTHEGLLGAWPLPVSSRGCASRAAMGARRRNTWNHTRCCLCEQLVST